MSDVATLIADLVRAGVDPDLIGRTVEALTTREPAPYRSPAAIRQERYRRNKASQSVTRDADVTESDACDASVTPGDDAAEKAVSPTPPSQKPYIPHSPPTGARTPIVSPARPEKRSAGCSLPDDWEPKPQHFDFATSQGFSPDWVIARAADMRDWAIGNRNRAIARKADWDRTFSGWLRREAEKTPSRNQSVVPFSQHRQERRNGHAISDALAELRVHAEAYDQRGLSPAGRGYGH